MLRQFELVTFARGALGIQIEQFGSGVAHLLHGATFGLVPSAAAQLMQRCGFRGSTTVTADYMQLCNWNIQLVSTGILQQQKFVLAFAKIKVNQAMITCDAMLFMHHRIARLELGQVAQHPFHVAFLCGARNSAARLRGIQLTFCNNRQLVILQHKTILQRPYGKHEVTVTGEKLRIVITQCRYQAVFAHILGHYFAPSQTVGEQQHPASIILQKALKCMCRNVGAPIYRNVGQFFGGARSKGFICPFLLEEGKGSLSRIFFFPGIVNRGGRGDICDDIDTFEIFRSNKETLCVQKQFVRF